MAERQSGAAVDTAIPEGQKAGGSSFLADIPAPSAGLDLSMIILPVDSILHRVHLAHYGATAFNPGIHGNARFSPIRNAEGQPIPTLYAGATLACALMETVFHDVPHVPGFKSLDRARFIRQVHSTLTLFQPLQLVDLASIPLRRLGISRRQLIDTEKDTYPVTRRWAEAIHMQCPTAQGLSWISRQDDSARALMLFGDRIEAGSLVQSEASSPLLDEAGTCCDAVLDLAERLGVCIVSAQ